MSEFLDKVIGAVEDMGFKRGADGVYHKDDQDTDPTIDKPPTDTPELQVYQFVDTRISGFTAGIRGGGTDKFGITLEGKGGPEWRATYESGEEVAKGAPREYMLDSVTLDAIAPGTEGQPNRPVQLRLANRSLWAKVTTGHTDDDGLTTIVAKVEMSVYRHGGGFVSDPTGDIGHDCGIMSPDLFLAIGRVSGLTGRLTLVRAAEARQGDLFEPEYTDPCPAPEGTRERTLSRGKKPAVAAFESALSAVDADGNPVEVTTVRAFYDSRPDAILRTWDAGPVKVVVDHVTKYVMAMPADAEEGKGDATRDDADFGLSVSEEVKRQFDEQSTPAARRLKDLGVTAVEFTPAAARGGREGQADESGSEPASDDTEGD